MRLALRVMHGGTLPEEAKLIETLWASAATPTPGATTDSVVKQIQSGAIPAQSDVVRERLGYSVVERQRLALDDKRSATQEFLSTLAHSDILKDSRADQTAAREITGGKPQPPAAPAQ